MSLTSLLSSMNRTRGRRSLKAASSGRKRAFKRRVFLEALEDRRLLAVLTAGSVPDPSHATLELWLDAGTLAANTTSVAAWDDLSSNDFDANQSSTSLRPTYVASNPVFAGLPSVRFDGSDVLSSATGGAMGISGNANRTIFFVFSKVNGNQSSNILGYGANAGNQLFDVGLVDNERIYGHFYFTDWLAPSPTFTLNQMAVGAVSHDGATFRTFKCDVDSSGGGSTSRILNTNPNGAFLVGQGQYSPYNNFQGDVAEILVYSEKLSDADFAAVHKYLYTKYTTGGLPNSAPVIAANTAAVSGNEGGTVSNTGTFSDSDGANTVTFTSKVGGVPFGTVTPNAANGTWSWSANVADGPAGPLTVTITATDDQGVAANATFTYAVNNVPPTISLSGNATVNEGSPYTLKLGNVTDPGLDTITSYIINWGDGTNSGIITGNPANTTATHTFGDGPANLTNTVTVTDEDGNVLAGGLTVRVLNVAPTIALTGNSEVNEGSLYTLNLGAKTDPGDDTVTAYSINWGDGSSTGTLSGNPANTTKTHTYADGTNAYTITVTLTDEDGIHSNASLFVVTVNNVAPTVSGGAFTIDENRDNGTVVGSASATDPGVDTFTFSIIAGNTGGAFAIHPTTGQITVANKAAVDFETTPVFNLTVAATDSDNAVGTATVTVNLNNLSANLSINDVTHAEGTGGGITAYTFTATLSAFINDDFTINYDTADNTAVSSGPSSDYTTASGMLSFNGTAGETKQFTVNVNADNIVEANEQFAANLSGLAGTNDVTVSGGPVAGLVSYWKADGDATDSADGNHGTLFGNAGFATGQFGPAFDLDGSGDWVQVPDSANLDFTGSLTISAWINSRSSLSNRIVDKITAGFADGYLLDLHPAQKLRFIADGQFVTGASIVPLNQWVHVAGVFNGTQLKVFVNGVLDGMLAASVAIPTNAHPLRIGADSNGSNGFNGLIDNIQLFNTALTSSEIAQLATGAVSATGTITNDDSATVSIGDASVTEGGNLAFPVTLTNPVDVNTVITYSTANGTATTADSDYAGQTAQTLTIPAGLTSGTITIATTADSKVELDETLTVNLSAVAASGRAVTIPDGTGDGTIVNNDSATVTIGNASVTEGGNLAFPVTLSNPVDVDSVITYSTANNTATTADNDYTGQTGQTLTIPAGQTSGTITVATTADKKVELNEALHAYLTAIAASGRNVGTGAIGTNFDITFVSGHGSGQTVQGTSNGVGWSTTGFVWLPFTVTNGTFTGFNNANFVPAVAATDVVHGLDASNFTLTFDCPISSAMFYIQENGGSANLDFGFTPVLVSGSVNIVGTRAYPTTTGGVIRYDNINSNTLSHMTNVFDGLHMAFFVSSGCAAGTIVNDDRASLIINDVSQVEGDATGTTQLTFTVSIDPAGSGTTAAEDITVVANTSGVSATGGGVDFTDILNQTVTIAAGSTSATVVVDVTRENLAELDETLTVSLSDARFNGAVDATRVVIGDSAGTGTIQNDDYVPVANAGGPYVINEGSSLTLNASASSDADVPADTLTYRWDVDGDGDYDENVTGESPTLTQGQMAALGLNDGLDSRIVTVLVSDGTNSDTDTTTLTIDNVAPTVTGLSGDTTVDESGITTHTYSYSISDPGVDTVQSVSVSCGTGGTFVSETHSDTSGSFVCKFLDGLATPTVSASATDSDNATGNTAELGVMVNNVAPHDVVINAAVSELVFAVGSFQTFDGSFKDVSTADTHGNVGTYWTFTHLNEAGTEVTETRAAGVIQVDRKVSNAFSFTGPGVYTATLTVTDDDGGFNISDPVTFVVYDPSAGFVTGGGWITSPAGADRHNLTATGKATFGFVSKYKNGATTPTGQTEFQFKAGNLNFHSGTYEWLVVAGARAQYKGEGTINGTGNYGFMLTAIDGQVNGGGGIDKFRIKIWDKNNDDALRYDNQNPMDDSDNATPSTAIGGGQIKIHKGGNAQTLAAGSTNAGSPVHTISQQDLEGAVRQAITHWASEGISADQLVMLSQVDVELANLPGSILGLASESTNAIWIDVDAAGQGWSTTTAASSGVDLLSTVTHEFGHSLGLDHDVLGATLNVGLRMLPSLNEDRHGHSLLSSSDLGASLLGGSYLSSQLKSSSEWLDNDTATSDAHDRLFAEWMADLRGNDLLLSARNIAADLGHDTYFISSSKAFESEEERLEELLDELTMVQ